LFAKMLAVKTGLLKKISTEQQL